MVPDQKTINMYQCFERCTDSYTYKCKICGKIVANMRNHYLMHRPEKHYCPVCNASRTRLDNLKAHCKEKHPEYNVRDLFTTHHNRHPFERSEFFNTTVEYFN